MCILTHALRRLDKVKDEIKRLSQTGDVRYFVRFNPDCFPNAEWREYDVRTYFKNLPTGRELDGPLAEVRLAVYPEGVSVGVS